MTNSSIDSPMPINIAKVRSKTTVATIVTMNWAIDVLILRLNIRRMTSHSFIRQAVTTSTPARADSGCAP
jgi:hypothetical protein